MQRHIGIDEFKGDGRGPELVCLRWSGDGRTLCAAEYVNLDDPSLHHIVFQKIQAVMITPEEVIGIGSLMPKGGAYAIDLGRSAWLESFNSHHLSRCTHYRFLFYDELLDVICEGIHFRPGSFTGRTD